MILDFQVGAFVASANKREVFGEKTTLLFFSLIDLEHAADLVVEESCSLALSFFLLARLYRTIRLACSRAPTGRYGWNT